MTKKDLIKALEKYEDDALVIVDVFNKHHSIALTPSSISTNCLALSIQISAEETEKVRLLFEQVRKDNEITEVKK